VEAFQKPNDAKLGKYSAYNNADICSYNQNSL